MKKIIDGKAYNTETATMLATVSHPGSGFIEERPGLMVMGGADVKDAATSTLYQTRGGVYFLVRERKGNVLAKGDWIGGGEIQEPGLHPLTRKEALAWAEKLFDVKKIEAMFGEIPEAGMKAGSILLRLPEPLKKRIEGAAKDAEQSVNAWAMRCIEDRCNRAELVHELAIAFEDLFDLTFEPGRFTVEGCQKIAKHALGAIEDALRTLKIDDLSKVDGGHVEPGLDRPNWGNREHEHLRTPEWQ